MSTDRISPDVSDGNSPNPRPGFETDVIREVEGLFSALPSGTATVHVGRVPGHADWPEPYFEVAPTNSKAARFEGIAVVDDLTLIIGEAEREFVGFARGGSVVRGASWQQELRWIWQTVLAGGFAQHHYLDSRGKVIGWSGTFLVNGYELLFRNGRQTEHLFGRKRVREITYERYILDPGLIIR
jgi:hypothetical protein